jgi:tetratricopeptide (TPR) repeat protein
MRRGALLFVLLVSLITAALPVAPSRALAVPSAQQGSRAVVADADGNLYLLRDGVLSPVDPPIVSAQFLARFSRGPGIDSLPGDPGASGELVRAVSVTLWWLSGTSRHEVAVLSRADDPVLMELSLGEPLDLSGAEERAARAFASGAEQPVPTAPTTADPTATAAPAVSTPAATPAAATPTSAAASDAAVAAVAAARGHIARRHFDLAIAALRPHEGSGRGDVFGTLAEAYWWRTAPEDLRKSIEYSTKAISAEPNVVRHYRWRGMAFQSLGRHTRPEALADFQRAVDTALKTGQRPTAGDYTAIADLHRLLARQSGVFDRSRLEEASKAATLAMGYDNDFTPAYVIRALVKSSLGEGGSAQDIQKAFQIDPGSTDPQHIAWHALASYWSAFLAPDINVRGRSNQYFSESWTYWDKYISLMESDPAKLAVKSDSWEAMQITPDWAYYNRGVSISWENVRDRDKILADFGRAIQLNPREPAFWYQRGRYYYSIGANAAARGDLQKYMELMGNDDDGNKGEAAAMLRKIGNS